MRLIARQWMVDAEIVSSDRYPCTVSFERDDVLGTPPCRQHLSILKKVQRSFSPPDFQSRGLYVLGIRVGGQSDWE